MGFIEKVESLPKTFRNFMILNKEPENWPMNQVNPLSVFLVLMIYLFSALCLIPGLIAASFKKI